ncbi:hypothetical protein [Pseudomonas sp. Pseu.R1]|uniref:hypothetical protein n=1 Tax=Pseudomonas sp. Pseu.R1 TaxID=3379818 RepID=UPI003B95CBDE
MNSSAIPGDDKDANDPIQPLEPESPDGMPDQNQDDAQEQTNNSKPAPILDGDILVDEDMSDVEANDSVSQEHPPQR